MFKKLFKIDNRSIINQYNKSIHIDTYVDVYIK